jgi:hypothetical protein
VTADTLKGARSKAKPATRQMGNTIRKRRIRARRVCAGLTGVSGFAISSYYRQNPGTECAGINRHVVGDERALQERRSDSILTSSLAPVVARRQAKRR